MQIPVSNTLVKILLKYCINALLKVKCHIKFNKGATPLKFKMKIYRSAFFSALPFTFFTA